MALDRREQESLAGAGRQVAEGAHELAHDQAALLMGRMGKGIGGDIVEAHGWAQTAQARDELVALNAEQPSAEIRSGTKRLAADQRLHGGLLDQIVGAVAIVGQCQGIDAQARQDSLEVGIESLAVVRDFNM